MAGKEWKADEERFYWLWLIPRSVEQVGADRQRYPNPVPIRHLAAQFRFLMQEHYRRMNPPRPAPRSYTPQALFEHYWKNVKDGRPSQHAKQYVADHRRAAALDGKSLVKRDHKKKSAKVIVDSDDEREEEGSAPTIAADIMAAHENLGLGPRPPRRQQNFEFGDQGFQRLVSTVETLRRNQAEISHELEELRRQQRRSDGIRHPLPFFSRTVDRLDLSGRFEEPIPPRAQSVHEYPSDVPSAPPYDPEAIRARALTLHEEPYVAPPIPSTEQPAPRYTADEYEAAQALVELRAGGREPDVAPHSTPETLRRRPPVMGFFRSPAAIRAGRHPLPSFRGERMTRHDETQQQDVSPSPTADSNESTASVEVNLGNTTISSPAAPFSDGDDERSEASAPGEFDVEKKAVAEDNYDSNHDMDLAE